MTPDTGTESLMARYQEGDHAAAMALVNRLSPQLHRFFAVQSTSRQFADDLLQETWMRIHQARHTYRPGEPLLPWLYAIARHVRIDHFRKAQRGLLRERELTEAAGIAQPSSSAGDGAHNVEALLAGLPESQREVVVLLKLADMSLEEVARATSSTVGAVKQKAHRAYERLRQLLPRRGGVG